MDENGRSIVRPLSPEELDEINPGIRKTVQWLRGLGFQTCDSGDGFTHDYECDREYPYVTMMVNWPNCIRDMNRLVHLLAERGVTCGPVGQGPSIQLSIVPRGDGSGGDLLTLDLQDVKDETLFPEDTILE